MRLQLRQNFDDPQHEFLTRRAVGRDKVLCAKELVSLRVAKAPSNLIGAPRAARTPVMEQFFFASKAITASVARQCMKEWCQSPDDGPAASTKAWGADAWPDQKLWFAATT